jgi:hypothetical protein
MPEHPHRGQAEAILFHHVAALCELLEFRCISVYAYAVQKVAQSLRSVSKSVLHL